MYDSGSDFETIVASVLPDYFNCSNDDISLEDRSGKKAIEPEYAAVGVVDGKTYAFIGLERQGGIMVYDVTDPANATFVNYLNSRDYSTDIAGDVAPEGLSFVSATDSATGEALLLAANEVSGTLAVIELTPYTAPVEEVVVEEATEVETPTVEETVVAPVVTPVVTPVVSTNTYTVQAGDCLWNIASRELGAGARWGELLELNPISNVYGLQIGQVLILPSK
ncbi:LysM peptidoglycan-binding domain-containing protein [Bengtsoniella intestinalis]